MVKTIENEYQPDVVSPPGATLAETLEELGMSQTDLAKRTGRPIKTINEIIKGITNITSVTALQFERVLGIPSRFWLNRDRHYQEYLARQRETEKLKEQIEWLKEIPYRAMVKLGWIQESKDKVEMLRNCLNFFGVASPNSFQTIWGQGKCVVFRQSKAFQSDPGSVAAWLRKGVLDAQHISCALFNASEFRESLSIIRNLTREPPEVFEKEMVQLCAKAGVAVVFVPKLPKLRVSGATCWLTKDKALIQLSLRYKTNDQFWFSFFHESGHILKHGKKDIFLEDHGIDDEKEKEADQFASQFLIPSSEYHKLRRLPVYSYANAEKFAQKIGIAPGIVVGRLQHDNLLPKTHLNRLKVRFRWANENNK